MSDEKKMVSSGHEVKPIKRRTKLKQKLLKKAHTHAGVLYPVGTPLENLKASDSTIEFLKHRDII